MKSLPPNRNHLLFFCIVHICSSLFSYAQDDPLKIERFTTENGLSSNVVYCVLQDKKGFLWIGNELLSLGPERKVLNS